MGKPEIRFKGYTDEWEQRKLGEYVSITSGEAPSKFEVGTELYVKVDDLNYNDKYVVDTQNKVAEHSTIKRVTKGSVIFPKRGAAIMTNKVRILGIDSYMDTNMMSLSSEKLDSEFLYNIISKEGLYKIADTSTIPQINNKHIEPYEVIIPSLDEQKRIGVYFRSLDHLITLHQRKCDEVKSLKKYMLQKMFPQNEQKVPEIRFEGFTEAWEQRKLGDVTESIKNGYTYKADGSREHQYKITRIESISSGAINIEKLGSSDNVNENYKLEDGDILFSHINSLPYIANTAIYTSNLGEIYHGMNLLNIRAKHEIIDSHFLLHLLKKESSRNWFRIIAKPAVNQASISTTEVSSFVFMMPNMEEQKRISSVLDNIDNLLTLHQQKCEELKKIKKFMLQKMFV